MNAAITSALKKIILFFLVIFGLYAAKAFLMPLFIGGILATLLLPLCRALERKMIKGLAVMICFLIVIAIVTGLGALVGWEILELVRDTDLIKIKTIEAIDSFQQYIFLHFNISVVKQTSMLKNEQFSVAGAVQNMVGSLSYIVTNFVLVLAYIFFLLYYRTHIHAFLIKLTKLENQTVMIQVIHDVSRVSQSYLVGLFKMIVCLWIMYSIGFSLLGVKNAIFFAILCGLLEIVPFIGNITGTTLTVLVAALHGASASMIGGIILTYGVVQFIQGWILEPLILGPQVKINPLFTIIALIAGQLIWGIPGIILAIPITAMFKIICDQIEVLKPIGFLIGETVLPKKKPEIIEKLKTVFR